MKEKQMNNDRLLEILRKCYELKDILNKTIPFEIGGIYDFYADGKIRESRHSQVKVKEFVSDLFTAKEIVWEIKGKQVSLWDIWKKTIKNELKCYDSVSYRIFDWGCTNFVICNPIDDNGKVDEDDEVIFARTADGGWYTIEDDEWNGRLMIPNSNK
jgi:hypothetical protein